MLTRELSQGPGKQGNKVPLVLNKEAFVSCACKDMKSDSSPMVTVVKDGPAAKKIEITVEVI